MTNNSFLAELALANFEIKVKDHREKIFRMESAIRWEQQKQRYLSSLAVLLESAHLEKQELHYVLIGIFDDDPETLLKKIKFVNDRMPEARDPRKQFAQRMNILG